MRPEEKEEPTTDPGRASDGDLPSTSAGSGRSRRPELPTQMRAAVFESANQPLHLVEDWPRPDPGDDELLVRVAACGVCHTDLHYLDHGVPPFKRPPIILGHEAAGTVAACGSGVDGWPAGSRVLIPAVLTCGQCEPCRRGRENLCEQQQMVGNHRHGAYAEFCTVPARDAVRLPDELPLQEASIIADAVTTPYHAVVHRARVVAGEHVAVFGCGGVGMNAVQVAAAAGASVVAVDLDEGKLKLALELGATDAVLGGDEAVRDVKRATGKVDAAFEAIGRPETIAQALATLRPGGRLCLIGYCPEAVPLPVSRMMFRELSVFGSLGCRPVDYPRVVELVRRGKLQIEPLISHRFPLERIGEAFDALRRGDTIRALILP